jgi:hypothetical protein
MRRMICSTHKCRMQTYQGHAVANACCEGQAQVHGWSQAVHKGEHKKVPNPLHQLWALTSEPKLSLLQHFVPFSDYGFSWLKKKNSKILPSFSNCYICFFDVTWTGTASGHLQMCTWADYVIVFFPTRINDALQQDQRCNFYLRNAVCSFINPSTPPLI